MAGPVSHPTNQHYDVSPAIYEAFLDRNLKYSSALFGSDHDDLDTAQVHKMRFVAAQLNLSGGQRVLDVGAGWGSLALHLATELSCTVTAVTPSEEQAAFVEQRAEARGVAAQVDVVTAPVESLDLPERAFDGVTMLGSIVHMPDREGVLRRAYRSLRWGGRLYLSESCFRSQARYDALTDSPGTSFVRDEIFGAGDMVPLSVLVKAAEDAGFSLCALHDLTAHYKRTIDHWLANARRNTELLERHEPGLTDRLVRYFETANAGWGYATKHYAIVGARRR